jgi:hypothetical protein
MAQAKRIEAIAQPQQNARQSGHLLGPILDPLLLGWASIAIALGAYFFSNREQNNSSAWFVYYIGFLVNYPHFIASYQLLYVDSRKKIFKEPRFIWAGVIVPLALLAGIQASFAVASPFWIGIWANAMYFFVGWHYVKQIFGCVIVTNALQKFYYTAIERHALKASLLSLWALSWVNSNTYRAEYAQDGVKYFTLGLPSWVLPATNAVVVITLGFVLLTHLKKFVREGRLPANAAVASYLTIFIWFVPLFAHPLYAPIIPFFHSLQYLPFVIAFRRNKVNSELEAPKATPQGRAELLRRHLPYYLSLFVVGGLAFQWVPQYLDSFRFLAPEVYGPTGYLFAFTIFLNIHHYFIDNVIWRGDNPDMRAHLR